MSGHCESPVPRCLLVVMRAIAIIDLIWWLLEISFVMGTFAVAFWQGPHPDPTTDYPAPIITFTRFGFSRILSPDSPLAWIGTAVVCLAYFCLGAFLALWPYGLLIATEPETPLSDAIEMTGGWLRFTKFYLVYDLLALIDPDNWSGRSLELNWTILAFHGIGVLVNIMMGSCLIVAADKEEEEPQTRSRGKGTDIV